MKISFGLLIFKLKNKQKCTSEINKRTWNIYRNKNIFILFRVYKENPNYLTDIQIISLLISLMSFHLKLKINDKNQPTINVLILWNKIDVYVKLCSTKCYQKVGKVTEDICLRRQKKKPLKVSTVNETLTCFLCKSQHLSKLYGLI